MPCNLFLLHIVIFPPFQSFPVRPSSQFTNSRFHCSECATSVCSLAALKMHFAVVHSLWTGGILEIGKQLVQYFGFVDAWVVVWKCPLVHPNCLTFFLLSRRSGRFASGYRGDRRRSTTRHGRIAREVQVVEEVGQSFI